MVLTSLKGIFYDKKLKALMKSFDREAASWKIDENLFSL